VNVRLQFPQTFTWQRIGDVLRIRGTLLREGTYTGLDGHTIYYPADVIREALPTIIGKPLKAVHADMADVVVGFVTAAREVDGGVEIEGVIFDKDEIRRIENAEKTGLSMEADVEWEEVPGYEVPVARKITFTGGAVVENPACPTCRVESTARIRLEEEKGKMSEETEMQKKPTREEFFNWIRDQLKKAGIEEAVIDKIIDVLKGAIKTPYPYPYPSPTSPTPKKQEEPQMSIEDIEAAIRNVLQTELEKPTRAAFLRWLRKQFKEAGFDRAAIGKILAIIKKAIKTPYPYPYPKPVKAKGSADVDLEAIWDETVAELENEVDKLETEIEQKEIELENLRKQLEELQKKELQRKEEMKTELINRIKEIDEHFDEKKFLEGVDNIDAQIKVLNSYLETVQRLKPAIKLAGVAATPEGEKKAEEVILSMFGDEEALKDLISPQKEGD